jgi:hypothetical protein
MTMSYRTLEVELENGRVSPRGSETLPAKAHALLTLLDSKSGSVASDCCDLAERWASLDRLPAEEAISFAADMEESRLKLPGLNSRWD